MADDPVIAALYVQKDGAYYGLPDVDPWDEERDARLYAGPWLPSLEILPSLPRERAV